MRKYRNKGIDSMPKIIHYWYEKKLEFDLRSKLIAFASLFFGTYLEYFSAEILSFFLKRTLKHHFIVFLHNMLFHHVDTFSEGMYLQFYRENWWKVQPSRICIFLITFSRIQHLHSIMWRSPKGLTF